MGYETKQGRPVWVITPGATNSHESYLAGSLLFGYVGVGYSDRYLDSSDARRDIEKWRSGEERVDWGRVDELLGENVKNPQNLAIYFVRRGDVVWLKAGQSVLWRGEAMTDYPICLEREGIDVLGLRSSSEGEKAEDCERIYVHGSSHRTVIRVRWDDQRGEVRRQLLDSLDGKLPIDCVSVLDRCLRYAELPDDEWRKPFREDGVSLPKLLAEGMGQNRLMNVHRKLTAGLLRAFEGVRDRYPGAPSPKSQFSIGWNRGMDAQGELAKVLFGADALLKLQDDASVESVARSSCVEPIRRSPLAERLKRVRNLVLEGVPGTGKTFVIKEICAGWPRDEDRRLQGNGSGRYAITLHPATSYEDFVEGIRPTPRHTAQAGWSKPVGEATKVSHDTDFEHFFHVQAGSSAAPADVPAFSMQDGFFLRVCAEAVNNPDADFVVLLDEFNRCNVPKVMGDLLTTLERSKRATWNGNAWDLSNAQVVTLPGSKRHFFVPDNVFVLACMNTTDRSVAPLDAALRRRFAFHRLWPEGFEPKTAVSNGKAESLPDAWTIAEKIWGSKEFPPDFGRAVTLWTQVNGALRKFGPDAMLGHSYLYDLAKDLKEAEGDELVAMVGHHWNDHILPQLAEILTANNIPWVKFKERLGEQEAVGVIVDRTHKDAVGFLRVPILHLKDSTTTPANNPSADEQPNEQD